MDRIAFSPQQNRYRVRFQSGRDNHVWSHCFGANSSVIAVFKCVRVNRTNGENAPGSKTKPGVKTALIIGALIGVFFVLRIMILKAQELSFLYQVSTQSVIVPSSFQPHQHPLGIKTDIRLRETFCRPGQKDHLWSWTVSLYQKSQTANRTAIWSIVWVVWFWMVV